MKRINLNREIYFELTERGKERLTDKYFAARVKLSENGLYSTQMWVFCGLFGKEMQCPGETKDVKTDVYLRDEDLDEANL